MVALSTHIPLPLAEPRLLSLTDFAPRRSAA